MAYLATLVHQGSPWAHAWPGSGQVQAPSSSAEDAEDPLFGGEGFRNGFCLPLSNGAAAMATNSRRSSAPWQPAVSSLHQDRSVGWRALPRDAAFT